MPASEFPASLGHWHGAGARPQGLSTRRPLSLATCSKTPILYASPSGSPMSHDQWASAHSSSPRANGRPRTARCNARVARAYSRTASRSSAMRRYCSVSRNCNRPPPLPATKGAGPTAPRRRPPGTSPHPLRTPGPRTEADTTAGPAAPPRRGPAVGRRDGRGATRHAPRPRPHPPARCRRRWSRRARRQGARSRWGFPGSGSGTACESRRRACAHVRPAQPESPPLLARHGERLRVDASAVGTLGERREVPESEPPSRRR